MDDNAAGSAGGHIDVGGDAPAAGGTTVEHQAGGDAVALPVAEPLMGGSDGSGGLAGNDAGGEVVGTEP